MPAILNNHIETIFDYDLTDEERELLTYGLSEFDYDKVSSIDSKVMALASLLGMRGDKEKSKLYLNKLNHDFVKTNIKWDSLILSKAD